MLPLYTPSTLELAASIGVYIIANIERQRCYIGGTSTSSRCGIRVCHRSIQRVPA
jgi:hypothetical protein